MTLRHRFSCRLVGEVLAVVADCGVTRLMVPMIFRVHSVMLVTRPLVFPMSTVGMGNEEFGHGSRASIVAGQRGELPISFERLQE